MVKVDMELEYDMLTTTIMACKCKKSLFHWRLIRICTNPIVHYNLAILQHYGYEVIEPASGYLACGDELGKMPEPETLLTHPSGDCEGKRSDRTKSSGNRTCPTQEAIDRVATSTKSFIGKDGICTGKSSNAPWSTGDPVEPSRAIEPPPFVKSCSIVTAKEMFDAATSASFEAGHYSIKRLDFLHIPV